MGENIDEAELCAGRRVFSEIGARYLRYVDAVAWLRDVHDDQADAQGERTYDFEVEKRLASDASNFLDVLHVRDAAHYREEDDWRDHHLHEIDERVADRLHRLPPLWCDCAEKDAE